MLMWNFQYWTHIFRAHVSCGMAPRVKDNKGKPQPCDHLCVCVRETLNMQTHWKSEPFLLLTVFVEVQEQYSPVYLWLLKEFLESRERKIKTVALGMQFWNLKNIAKQNLCEQRESKIKYLGIIYVTLSIIDLKIHII